MKLFEKDLLKWAGHYITLAEVATGISDQTYIDNIKSNFTAKLNTQFVALQVNSMAIIPKDWRMFFELIVTIYKNLHAKDMKESIFSNSSKVQKDPNAMEVDVTVKGKGKAKHTANSMEEKQTKSKDKFCQFCADAGNAAKSKTHNTSNCWLKDPSKAPKRAAAKTGNTQGSTAAKAASNGK